MVPAIKSLTGLEHRGRIACRGDAAPETGILGIASLVSQQIAGKEKPA